MTVVGTGVTPGSSLQRGRTVWVEMAMGDAEDAAPKVQRWPAAGGREALELLGYVDLSVRQRVTKPPEIEPLLNIADRSDIMLISSVSGLLIAARRGGEGRPTVTEAPPLGPRTP